MANSYLTKTFSGAQTNAKKGTFSGWFKLSSGSDTYYRMFVTGADQNNRTDINITNPTGTAGELNMQHYISGTGYFLVTNRLFRDFNAWYHILVSYDTTLATGSDRVKLYVNGTRETSFSTSDMNNIPQNTDLLWGNNSSAHHIGNSPHFSPRFFNGYMSHVSYVDGTALTPTSFGETDSTSGIWKFKQPTGVTWGNNGFHLKFENSAALGTDSSGNTNTFTVNGNLKQAVDTPSNVYCTLNPLVNNNSNLVLSNGNNTMTLGSTSWIGTVSSLGVNTGKWYWEIKVDTNNLMHGVLGEKANMTELSTSNSGYIGKFSNGYAFYYQSPNARKQNNNSHANYGTAPSSGDILMVAFDATNGTIWIGKNGSWFNSATQSEIENGTTTNSMYSSIPMTETFFPAACGENNHVANYNFGNGFFGTTAITSAGSNGNGSLFEYDVPSGYYALNTKNINTYG